MNEKNSPALKQEIVDKLGPAHAVLVAFKTFWQTAEVEGVPTAIAALTADLKVAIEGLNKTEMVFSKKTNEQIAAVDTLPHKVSGITGSESESYNALLSFMGRMYKETSTKEKVFLDRFLPGRKTLRRNRDPMPSAQKFAHKTILTQLVFFGAFPKTDSDFSDAEKLTNEEMKVVFDLYCGVCRKPHEIEAVKRLKNRFLNDLFARASKYKGNRVAGIHAKE